MMLAKFRHKYPQGSLLSELIKIDRGTYIVKAFIEIDRVVLATALASGATVEAAEDAAKERAIASLFLEDSSNIAPQTNRSDRSYDAPASPAATIQDSASANTSSDRIVNFYKPAPAASASEPSTPHLKSSASRYAPPESDDKSILETATANTPVRQPNLDTPSEPSSQPSSNLFGDTFAVATPTTSPTAIDSANFASQPVGSSELEAMDFNEIKQKTDIEIRRLGWTKEQGREFLMSRYGKKSRLHLKDEQLIEFLHYLEDLPSPVK